MVRISPYPQPYTTRPVYPCAGLWHVSWTWTTILYALCVYIYVCMYVCMYVCIGRACSCYRYNSGELSQGGGRSIQHEVFWSEDWLWMILDVLIVSLSLRHGSHWLLFLFLASGTVWDTTGIIRRRVWQYFFGTNVASHTHSFRMLL